MIRIYDEQKSENTFPVAIVVSRFNLPITEELLNGALKRLKEKNFHDDQIMVAWVPGAVEIPIAAQRFAQQGTVDAVIALGAVIRGETSHYDYVCDQASQGCQQVALQNDVPVIFGVLTTENGEQAGARIGGAKGHKGIESVDAAIETVALLRRIS